MRRGCGRLFSGLLRMRSTKMTSTWVASDSMNQPVWNNVSSAWKDGERRAQLVGGVGGEAALNHEALLQSTKGAAYSSRRVLPVARARTRSPRPELRALGSASRRLACGCSWRAEGGMFVDDVDHDRDRIESVFVGSYPGSRMVRL